MKYVLNSDIKLNINWGGNMDTNRYFELSEKVNDGLEYDIDDVEKYQYVMEICRRMEISPEALFIMSNTVDYCKTYCEDYDEEDIIEAVQENAISVKELDDEVEITSVDLCEYLDYKVERGVM